MSQETLPRLYGRNLIRIVSMVPAGLVGLGKFVAAYLYIVSPFLAVMGLIEFGYLPKDIGWVGVAPIALGIVLSYLLVIVPLGMAINDRWDSEE